MGYRRGSFEWYDLLFFGLAGAIIYPDKILEWLGEHTGRNPGWRHLVILEAVSIGSLIAATLILTPSHPRLEWWHPLVHVGLLGGTRLAVAGFTRMFGFD